MDRNELITKVRGLSAKATPGPWSQYAHGTLVYGGNGKFITTTQSAAPEADAALIAVSPEMAVELLRLAEENESLRAALEPFGSCANDYHENEPNDTEVDDGAGITVGQLRHARAALAGQPATDRDADHG